ncbi:hypothetical protein K2X30_02065 [bacterium]|jgi:hypothetical protein|nr:hypothetical protein [bacterium]
MKIQSVLSVVTFSLLLAGASAQADLTATPGNPVCVKRAGAEDVDAISSILILDDARFKHVHNPFILKKSGYVDATSPFNIAKVRARIEALGRPAQIKLALSMGGDEENVQEMLVLSLTAADETSSSVSVKAGPGFEAFECNRTTVTQEDFDKRGVVNADEEIHKILDKQHGHSHDATPAPFEAPKPVDPCAGSRPGDFEFPCGGFKNDSSLAPGVDWRAF